MKEIIFLILLILLLSCSNKSLNINIGKSKSQNIFIKFKDVPTFNKSLNVGSMSINSSEPFIQYNTFRKFKASTIKIDDRTNFISKIYEDTIFLNLKYDFDKKESFMFVRGDSVLITYENGIPKLTEINRNYNKYDFDLSKSFKKLNSTLSFGDFLLKHKRFRTKKENIKQDILIQKVLKKKILILDSIKILNELTDYIYKYNRRKFIYALDKSNNEVKDLILRNNDLHISSFRSMLVKYVNNNLKNKFVAVNNGKTFNSVEAFDYVFNDTLLKGRNKDFLFWYYLKKIGNDFSRKIFIEKMSIYSKEFENKNLINDLKEEFLIKDLNISNNNIYLTDIKGKKKTLLNIITKNKNKLIYIDFWASWCSPCREEMKYKNKILQKYKNKDIVFVYISIDKNFNKWKKASKEENLFLNKYNLLAMNYPNANFYKEIGLKSIPRYILYNKSGKLIHENAPNPSSKDFKEIIKNLLKK